MVKTGFLRFVHIMYTSASTDCQSKQRIFLYITLTNCVLLMEAQSTICKAPTEWL